MNNTYFLKESLIAHRGCFDKERKIPENSIPAFEKAILGGYIIELDVHILKDESVIVFHDSDLKRMTGVNKKLKDVTYNEIKDLTLDNTKYRIPLLTETLELVNGVVPILIELKSDAKVGKLEEKLIEILKNYKGNYAIQTFSPFSLMWFKKNYPDVIRGQLACDFKKDKKSIIEKFVLKNLFFNFLTKPDFISYGIFSLPNKNVEKYRNTGLLVLGWTIKNIKDLKYAEKYCDNFICNNLDTIDYKKNNNNDKY